jgi:mannose-1-phosphate guanylyltransferase
VRRAALILAGGGGTRLRPLSSDENPKQFLRLFEGRSLIEMTFDRVEPLVGADAIYVSTNDRYAEKTLEFLPRLPASNVITEPARRNTAPAIALSCRAIGDATVAVLASDHFIADEDEFRRVLDHAYRFAESHDALVAIGIEPKEPSSEFGYLELGEEIEPDVRRVLRFTEKPSLGVAEQFLAAGNYAWNAAMSVFRTSVFFAELTRVAPELARVTRETYDDAPAIAIDYALMEKASSVASIRGDFGWSDVGSFDALRRVGVDV